MSGLIQVFLYVASLDSDSYRAGRLELVGGKSDDIPKRPSKVRKDANATGFEPSSTDLPSLAQSSDHF